MDQLPTRPDPHGMADDAHFDDDGHDPETGEVDAQKDVGNTDAPFDWPAWLKSMGQQIAACETIEELAELQTDNNGLIAELGSAKPKLAEKLNMRFGDRARAIGDSE